METWYSKSIGDGVDAFEPFKKLYEYFFALAKAGLGVPEYAAVFSSYDIHANVVIWYFTPELTNLALMLDAAQCEKPTPSAGFGLLLGDGKGWRKHFPQYLIN